MPRTSPEVGGVINYQSWIQWLVFTHSADTLGAVEVTQINSDSLVSFTISKRAILQS